MLHWIKRLNGRRLLVILAVSVCGVAAFTLAGEDPVLVEMAKLEKSANQIFKMSGVLGSSTESKKPLDKEAAKKKVKEKAKEMPTIDLLALFSDEPDMMRPLNDPKLVAFIQQMQKTKEFIERAADERKDLSIYADEAKKKIDIPKEIGAMMEATNRYLILQKRLYENLMKNAHERAGLEKHFAADLYDAPNSPQFLNLRLSLVIAEAIKAEDRFLNQFNMWHSRDGRDNFDHVEFGLTPQDKDAIEERVLREKLKSSPDDKTYAKLLQLLVIRQRATNHWAIQRLSAQRIVLDPRMESCGENLVSFGYSSNRLRNSTFDFLGRNDEFNAYSSRVDGILLPLTNNLPLIGEKEESTLLEEFFRSFPNYDQLEPQIAATAGYIDVATGAGDVAAFRQEYFKTIKIRFNELTEDYWREKGPAALHSAAYPSDSFYREDVGARVAWIAFKTRKVNFVRNLEREALNVSVDSAVVNGKVVDKAQIRQVAEKFVNDRLAKVEMEWKKKLAARINDVYFKQQSFAFDRDQINRRFEKEVFTKLWPEIEKAAKAATIKQHVLAVEKEKCNEWDALLDKPAKYPRQADRCFKATKDWEVAFIQAKGNVTQRMAPWNGEQLKAFYDKKVKFWTNLNDDEDLNEDLNTNTRKIAARVKLVSEDKHVAELMKTFFGIVSSKYADRLKAQGKDIKNEGPGSTVLAEVLAESVAEIEKKLQEKIDSIKPKQKEETLEIKNGMVLVLVANQLIERKLTTPDALLAEIRQILGIKGPSFLAPNNTIPSFQSPSNGYGFLFPQPTAAPALPGLGGIAQLAEKYSPAQNVQTVTKLLQNKRYAKFLADAKTQSFLRKSRASVMTIRTSGTLLDVAEMLENGGYAQSDITFAKTVRKLVQADPKLAPKLPANSAKVGYEALVELGERYTAAENFQIINKLKTVEDYAEAFENEEVRKFLADAEQASKPKPTQMDLWKENLRNQRAVIDNVANVGSYPKFDKRMLELENKQQEGPPALTPKTAAELAAKFHDAMALLNLNDVTSGRHAIVPEGKYLNNRARFPREMETLVNRQGKGGFEDNLALQVTRSVLDQRMMAEVIHDLILSQNPILNIRNTNKVTLNPFDDIASSDGLKAPNAMDLILQRYSQARSAEDRKAGARLGLQAAIDVAARNIIEYQPVEEACYAHPFNRTDLEITKWSNDTKWNNVFSASIAYRDQLREGNKTIDKLDKRLAEFTRTPWAAVTKDILSPINHIVGTVVIIGLIAALGVAVVGGGWAVLGALAVEGTAGFATFMAGFSGAISGSAVATTAVGSAWRLAMLVGGKFMKSAAMKALMYVFYAELALSGHSLYYQMPMQLQYKLGIANSEIGFHTGVAMGRDEIAKFVAEIHQQRVEYKNSAKYLAMFMAAPRILKLVQFRSSLNYKGKGAVNRMSKVEGGADVIVAEKSLKEHIAEQTAKHGSVSGAVRGRYEYVQDALKRRSFYGKVTWLNPKTRVEDLVGLVRVQFQKIFKTSDELRALYVQRLKAIGQQVERLRMRAEQARMGNPNLQGNRLAQVREWMVQKLAVHAYNGQYMKIALDKAAMKVIQESLAKGVAEGGDDVLKSIPTKPGDRELYAMILEAYADDLDIMVKQVELNKTVDAIEVGAFDLAKSFNDGKVHTESSSIVLEELAAMDTGKMNESTYLMRKLLDLEVNLKKGLTPEQAYQMHLGSMHQWDWFRHVKAINWVVKSIDKPFAARVSPRFAGAAKDKVELARVFTDYQTLMQEITAIQDKVRAEYAKHFSEAADAMDDEFAGSSAADSRALDTDTKIVSDPKAKEKNLQAEEVDFEIEVTAEDGTLQWKKVPKTPVEPTGETKKKTGFRSFWFKAS